ncbi:MAG TPA: hypothetical protein PLE74_04575 [Candidatus Cloacimonadota bacterium]|nr:hypothetical protein [Candidatus Cloacimonadota bacterium]
MSVIFSYQESHTGKIHTVIPKIREISKAMGNVIITFDNGDRKTLDVEDADALIDHLLTELEDYYSKNK